MSEKVSMHESKPSRGKTSAGVSWPQLIEELDGPEQDDAALLKKIGITSDEHLPDPKRGRDTRGVPRTVEGQIQRLNGLVYKQQTASLARREKRMKYLKERVPPQNEMSASFGGDDLWHQEPACIREVQERLAHISPSELPAFFVDSSGFPKATAEFAFVQFIQDVASICINLAEHRHIFPSIECLQSLQRLAPPKNFAYSYVYEYQTKICMEALQRSLADRAGMIADPSDRTGMKALLQDAGKKERLAEYIQAKFAHTEPAFFLTCLQNMQGVFPCLIVEDGCAVRISPRYVQMLERSLHAGASDQVRVLVELVMHGLAHPKKDLPDRVLEGAVRAVDPVLRTQMFDACVHKEGLRALMRDHLLFSAEMDALQGEAQARIFALVLEEIGHLDGLREDFFGFIERLHLSFDQERVLLDRLMSSKEQDGPFVYFRVFSPEAQLYAVEHAKANSLEILGEHLGQCHNLPAAIADRLIERGQMKYVAKHWRCFWDLTPALIKYLETYKKISDAIEESPSRTVRRMKDALIEELFASADPEQVYKRIESIFLRNHIPLVGKIFLAFDAIYGEKRVQRAYSPTLKEASPRQARQLIYKDLLTIHLDTGNPSLRVYLQEIQGISPLIQKIEEKKDAELTGAENLRLDEFFRRIAVLRTTSLYGVMQGDVPSVAHDDRMEQLTRWKASLGVREGQSINERIEEMFLRPAGVSSIEQALQRMDGSRARANMMNRTLVTDRTKSLALREGDLLKSVRSAFFLSYLQNGNVAKECLGYAAGEDATALDTDTGRVLKRDAALGNKKALAVSPAGGGAYGDIVLVFRPAADRFFRTKEKISTNILGQLHGKTPPYELFQTPVVDAERHYGVRTGIPFTEVRWIIVPDPSAHAREILDLKMDIVANGYYVPLTDEEGCVLFRPEEFDRLAALYVGSSVMPGTRLRYVPDTESTFDVDPALHAFETRIAQERPALERIKSTIEARVKEALLQANIAIRTSGELATGAEMLNTGSTARSTSVPGKTVDFDMVIRLDEHDLKRQEGIKTQLDLLLPGVKEGGGVAQWRRTNISIEGTIVDVDITFVSKPEVEGVPSHLMVEERLHSLDGAGEGDRVRSHIVWAKQLLQKGGVYKKADGGLTGIGVENWIVQHGGHFARARRAFLRAAIDSRGKIRPFEQFAEDYVVPDPGVNLIESLDGEAPSRRKQHRHDNFISFLGKNDAAGFKKMVEVLQNV